MLDWMRRSPEGVAWLESLPVLVQECSRRWDLVLGTPYQSGWASLTLPAERPDGTRAVLKIQYVDRESDHEADALRILDGEGAVRLLEHDPGRRALLLERCEPGTPVHEELPFDQALDVIIGLLPRQWREAGPPIRTLAEEAEGWAQGLPDAWERGCPAEDRTLLVAALDALAELATTQGEQVLVNQDLQATNVLRAEREPWLVIDPKPLIGEREFGVAPVVRGGELGEGPEATRHRLDRVCDELSLDRERVRKWTLAQTLAWSYHEDGTFIREQVEIAEWLLRM